MGVSSGRVTVILSVGVTTLVEDTRVYMPSAGKHLASRGRCRRRPSGAIAAQLTVRLWIEARVPLLAAAMAGFGHAISEVGAATILGGNIHGQTQVMTTSIVEDVGRGDFNQALIYAAVLLALAFAINGLLTSVQQRAAAWAQS